MEPREIERAVGKVISIGGYRELTLAEAPEYARRKGAIRALGRGSERHHRSSPNHLT